ncbi:hypothetical protein [Actinocrispum sp. NPDC049592]|uniref:hypothetical protein n=1 Tax=Actinocrispum sp. NPDC049592 TaxID=3154835 RepID=UPI003433854C
MNETTGSFATGVGAFVNEAIQAIPTAPPNATLTVNHDNVLAAAKIIQTQIDALDDMLRNKAPTLVVDAAADDPVSQDAARAWNYRLVGADDSYASRITEYVLSLKKLVAQLKDSAKTYGFNEQDIAATFGTTVV